MLIIDAFTNFADRHWFLALVIIFFAGNIILMPLRLINRVIRHRNIAKAGWPPDHLDADGDKITNGLS